jgi:hypothetical protein
MKTAAELRKILQGDISPTDLGIMNFFAELAIAVAEAEKNGTGEKFISELCDGITRKEFAVASVFAGRARAVIDAFEDLADFQYAQTLIQTSKTLRDLMNLADLGQAAKQSTLTS